MDRFDDSSRPTVEEFLKRYFSSLPSLGSGTPTLVPAPDDERISFSMKFVADRFSRAKYILGLALDFALLMQQVSGIDAEAKASQPTLTIEQFQARYPRVLERGDRTANTLTITYAGKEVGIRKIEEQVAVLFHSLDRSDYPSAYVYNTGQWAKYQGLLLNCVQLGEAGRLELCKKLIDFGLRVMPRNRFVTRAAVRSRLFERVIESYARAASNENGGLTFQALAYGYIVAAHPHLTIVADKVRTGSSRQRRFGDIDCYYGLDLELSVEVKDFFVTVENLAHQLGTFQKKTAGQGIRGIAFVREIEPEARTVLEADNVSTVTQAEALAHVALWDWLQQDSALQAMLHYLAHIEQNPRAVYRLLEFIVELDPKHDSLAHRRNYAKSDEASDASNDESGRGEPMLDLS